MPGRIIYSEKCICGANINLAENYDFMATERLSEQFQLWQQRHSNCLPLFQRVQQARLTQLKAELGRGNE